MAIALNRRAAPRLGSALAGLGLLVAIAAPMPARSAVLDPALQAPVEARVPWAPAAVAATDGAGHLAYELHLSNFYRDTGVLRVKRLTVYADDSDTALADFQGEALQRIAIPRAPEGAKPADGVAIGGGLRGELFVWLTLPAARPAPTSLRHRIEFETTKGTKLWVDGARVALANAPPVVLGPPLRGGQWLAYEGPSNSQSHHWGSLVVANGDVTIPQRYALDLVGLDARGHAVRDGAGELRKTKHADWIGYGADVLAAADGIVRGARDGEAEHAPLSPQSEPSTLSADALYGNYVILEIAPRVYVHYAHLQRGSVAVKIGERVRRGQSLGRLGQSGNTGGPHLHLHVSNAPTFEQSEGLPFVFDAFSYSGTRSIDQVLDSTSAFDAKPQSRQAQMPLDNAVIGFDAKP